MERERCRDRARGKCGDFRFTAGGGCTDDWLEAVDRASHQCYGHVPCIENSKNHSTIGPAPLGIEPQYD